MAPSSPLETFVHLTQALSQCVLGGERGAVLACEGGETDFWYPLKTSDLVASGRGVMEIQKGAPSATRNQKRNLHDEQLRKLPSGPCALIRTTCEDLGKASVDTQESHTGTPKIVPEIVTWRSRPDSQEVFEGVGGGEYVEEIEPPEVRKKIVGGAS